MTRPFGGHSELGTILNKQGQKTAHLNIEKTNFKRAVIYKSLGGAYIFTMRLLDTGKITAPIPIVGSIDNLAMTYGSPKDMEGQFEVLISYKGSSVNRGIAQITRKLGSSLNNEIEESQQANQLQVKGTAFAPPGSGMV
jgi:hypothetical protein